jgi:hypothetical protein
LAAGETVFFFMPTTSNREAIASFCPAALYDLLAIGCAHALQEAMSALPLAPIGLVGSLHFGILLYFGEACIIRLPRSDVKVPNSYGVFFVKSEEYSWFTPRVLHVDDKR